MSLCSFNFKLCAPPPLINVWLFKNFFTKILFQVHSRMKCRDFVLLRNKGPVFRPTKSTLGGWSSSSGIS